MTRDQIIKYVSRLPEGFLAPIGEVLERVIRTLALDELAVVLGAEKDLGQSQSIRVQIADVEKEVRLHIGLFEASEIAIKLGVRRTIVSQHLMKLRRLGIVEMIGKRGLAKWRLVGASDEQA